MSTSRIHLVVGDTRPMIYVQLRQPAGLLDISTAVVRLLFKPWTDDEVLFVLPGELLPGTLQADLIHADLTQYPTPGSGGRVRFGFFQGNLNLPPGRYLGEIEAAFGVGNVFTPFTRLHFLLREDFNG
ncbi:MAG TPA: hypothetical protein VMT27_02715 [Actinomycetes bacterium]|nr:hypothetical protein [Actinomycetes bacterium]